MNSSTNKCCRQTCGTLLRNPFQDESKPSALTPPNWRQLLPSPRPSSAATPPAAATAALICSQPTPPTSSRQPQQKPLTAVSKGPIPWWCEPCGRAWIRLFGGQGWRLCCLIRAWGPAKHSTVVDTVPPASNRQVGAVEPLTPKQSNRPNTSRCCANGQEDTLLCCSVAFIHECQRANHVTALNCKGGPSTAWTAVGQHAGQHVKSYCGFPSSTLQVPILKAQLVKCRGAMGHPAFPRMFIIVGFNQCSMLCLMQPPLLEF